MLSLTHNRQRRNHRHSGLVLLASQGEYEAQLQPNLVEAQAVAFETARARLLRKHAYTNALSCTRRLHGGSLSALQNLADKDWHHTALTSLEASLSESRLRAQERVNTMPLAQNVFVLLSQFLGLSPVPDSLAPRRQQRERPTPSSDEISAPGKARLPGVRRRRPAAQIDDTALAHLATAHLPASATTQSGANLSASSPELRLEGPSPYQLHDAVVVDPVVEASPPTQVLQPASQPQVGVPVDVGTAAPPLHDTSVSTAPPVPQAASPLAQQTDYMPSHAGLQQPGTLAQPANVQQRPVASQLADPPQSPVVFVPASTATTASWQQPQHTAVPTSPMTTAPTLPATPEAQVPFPTPADRNDASSSMSLSDVQKTNSPQPHGTAATAPPQPLQASAAAQPSLQPQVLPVSKRVASLEHGSPPVQHMGEQAAQEPQGMFDYSTEPLSILTKPPMPVPPEIRVPQTVKRAVLSTVQVPFARTPQGVDDSAAPPSEPVHLSISRMAIQDPQGAHPHLAAVSPSAPSVSEPVAGLEEAKTSNPSLPQPQPNTSAADIQSPQQRPSPEASTSPPVPSIPSVSDRLKKLKERRGRKSDSTLANTNTSGSDIQTPQEMQPQLASDTPPVSSVSDRLKKLKEKRGRKITSTPADTNTSGSDIQTPQEMQPQLASDTPPVSSVSERLMKLKEQRAKAQRKAL